MKNKLHIRFLSVLLMIVTLLSSVAIPTYAENSPSESFVIMEGDVEAEQIVLPENERRMLTAAAPEGADIRWQIKFPGEEIWIDIMGQNQAELSVSVALVKQMLDENGFADIRCVASTEAGEQISQTVRVEVGPKTFMAEPQEEIIPEIPAKADPEITVIEAVEEESEVAREVFAEEEEKELPRLNAKMMVIPDEPIAMADLPTVYKVTIQYLIDLKGDGNLTQQYEPYIANVEGGTTLQISEVNPVIPGYAPYSDLDGDSVEEQLGEKFEKTLTVAEDVTYTIIYRRIPVSYAARYFLQNIGNDLYTEAETYYEEFVGYAGDRPYYAEEGESKVGAINKDIEGFSSLFHQPDFIAADGSTKFEIYYDRNYYLINFNLEGGYGTAPVYARYQTPFTVPDPTRAGYVFDGWELVSVSGGSYEATALPTEVPAANLTFRAKWKTEDTTYTVVYWRENANDNGYSYWTYETKTAESGTYVSGTSFSVAPAAMKDRAHFTYNERKTVAEESARTDLVDGKVVVEGDGSTTVNVYFSRNWYTLKFVVTGTCKLEEHKHTDACYVCTEHVHTAACLDCTVPVHVHDASCCELEHSHTEAGCVCVHSHVRSCYTTDTSGSNNNSYRNEFSKLSGGIENGYIYSRQNTFGAMTYWLYFNNQWYDATASACGEEVDVNNRYRKYVAVCNHNVHTDSCYNCGMVDHDHSSGCVYTCGIPLHQHTEECYSCSHVHSDLCKLLNCHLVEHTHVSDCDRSNKTNIFFAYRAKYDSDCSHIWNDSNSPVKEFLDDGYVFKSSLTDKYYSFLQKMPEQDITMTATAWSGNTYKWYYYLEKLDGKDYAGIPQRTDSGVSYYEYHSTTVKGSGISLTYEEDYFPITGYTQRDKNVPSFNNQRVAYLYYTRNTYKLTFMNLGDKEAEVSVDYEADISDIHTAGFDVASPSYPKELEPGAYEFAGWYTTPQFFEGTQFTFEGKTMPAQDILLYAKWTPIIHEVNFYYTYDHMIAAENGDTSVVPFASFDNALHGKVLETVLDVPTYPAGAGENPDDYDFVNWFYMEGGVKKAFNPYEMTIQQDLDLYAEWKTSIITEYTLHYVKYDSETDAGKPLEELTPIADPTTGHVFTGTTKSFAAKAGSALNLLSEEEKLQLWLPRTNSHSILMDVDAEKNVFYFVYETREKIPYTVRYLDATSREIIFEDKVVADNKLAAVMEVPLYQKDYNSSPGYYNLVLSLEPAENVITFLYTKKTSEDGGGGSEPETNHYHIVHYIEQLDGTMKQQEFISKIGEKGESVTAEILTLKGFSYVEDAFTTTVGGVVKTWDSNKSGIVIAVPESSEILTLNLYYRRNHYPYVVKHMIYDSGDTLIPETDLPVGAVNKEIGTAPYESEITKSPLHIPGYDVVTDLSSSGDASKTITIAVDELLPSGDTKYNIMKFYYKPKQVTIQYIPICATSYIDVSTRLTFSKETPTEYGAAKGSAPLTGNDLEFIGWYLDKECTIPVESNPEYASWIDSATSKLTPVITSELAMENDYEFRFYALFEPVTTTITIQKVVNGTSNTDMFLFRVQGKTGTITEETDLVVSIAGSGSVVLEGLYPGTYTVEELPLAWYYTCDDAEQTISAAIEGPNEVTFTNTYKSTGWLRGEGRKENQFKPFGSR